MHAPAGLSKRTKQIATGQGAWSGMPISCHNIKLKPDWMALATFAFRCSFAGQATGETWDALMHLGWNTSPGKRELGTGRTERPDHIHFQEGAMLRTVAGNNSESARGRKDQ